MHRRVVLALVATLALAAAACEPEGVDPLEEDPTPLEATPDDGETPDETAPADEDVDLAGDPEATVVEVLEGSGEFTALLDALEQAGLAEELSGEGPFTVFAPTDDAFDRLPEATRDVLGEDPEQLEAVLRSHAAEGEIGAGELTDGAEVEMMDGTTRTILVTGDGEVLYGPALVVAADAEASNGLVHAIDTVLSPGEPEEGEG